MPSRRALICHERFLPRFGADRVLIIIGKHLADQGYQVDFLGHRFPDDRLEGIASRIVEIPGANQYIKFDLETKPWVERWLKTESPYDLVVVGGWPFFSSIPLFREHAAKVVFVDCGVVPNEGYDAGTQKVLDHLRELRRTYIKSCTHIAPNSDFTMQSQTLPEIGDGGPICIPILNGIDHLAEPSSQRGVIPSKTLLFLRSLRAEGRKPILLLGRFETTGYKNSRAGLEVLRLLRRADPQCVLLVLDREEALQLDWELNGHVHGLGHVDDETLVNVMSEVDLALSVSVWEGFNLPIAEMYRLGKPALCFNLAAHPEVVIDPWFLCTDVIDMAAKAAIILCGGSKFGRIDSDAVQQYRNRFRWAKYMDELFSLLKQ